MLRVTAEAPPNMEDQAQAKQPETEQGKYVYCIIKTDIPRDFVPVGIGGRGDKVYTVPYKKFAAVVSNSREFFVRNGVDLVAASADSDRHEIARDVGLDDAVNVLALLRFGLLRLCLIFHVRG